MPLCYVSNKLSAIIERKLIEVRVSVNTAIVQGKAIEYYISDSAICENMFKNGILVQYIYGFEG